MAMKAVRVTAHGGPEVLKLETVPIPSPEEGEVLIRVHYAGVNPVDVSIRREPTKFTGKAPFICGGDASGVVESVGAGVTEFKKGDRVYTVANFQNGAYAEYVKAPVRLVAPLGDRLTFAQGAAIGVPYWTAHKSLYNRANTKPGETVLIHGASGAVGVATVQIARANGHRVIGTAGSEKGLSLVKSLGADLVFNHKEEGYMEQILKSTDGKGVDVILEMLANVNLEKDLDILAFRGRVVVVGCRGTIEISPRKVMFKESSISGVILTAVKTEEEWTEIAAEMSAGIQQGWLDPIIGREYPLEEAAQAQIDILSNDGTLGKLVIAVAK